MRHRRTKNILVNGRRDRAANKGGMTDSGHGRTNRGSKKRAGNRRKLPRKVGQRQYKREQLILDLPAPKKGATVAHHLHVGQKKKEVEIEKRRNASASAVSQHPQSSLAPHPTHQRTYTNHLTTHALFCPLLSHSSQALTSDLPRAPSLLAHGGAGQHSARQCRAVQLGEQTWPDSLSYEELMKLHSWSKCTSRIVGTPWRINFFEHLPFSSIWACKFKQRATMRRTR